MRNFLLVGLFWVLSTSAAFADLSDQLIGHYPLNGDAVDVSGNDNHGVINGAVPANDFRELANSALAFDGVDDTVTVSSIGDWGSELTLSFWARADSASAGQAQIFVGSRDLGNSATLVNFYASMNSEGFMRWRLASWTTHSDLLTSRTLPLDRWVHVICDWSATSGVMRILWDGEVVASGPVGDAPRYLNADIGLGSFCDGCGNGSSFFDGRLDETRIYNRLLTDGEISTLSGRTAVYELNGDAIDTSGNERHGTVAEAIASADRFGTPGSAMEFDGVDDLIDTPTIGNWGSELGFSFWMKPDQLSEGASQTLLGSRRPGSGGTKVNFAIRILADGSLNWLVASDGNNSNLLTSASVIEFDRWTQVVCDWSQLTGTMRIFFDGDLVASGPIGDAPRYYTRSIGIGNYGVGYESTSVPFHGSIDQMTFHNRILTEQEIYDFGELFFADGFESGDLSAWSASSP